MRLIQPQEKDLGGFSVRRVLPARAHRKVGPFVFFDHMGPAELPPGQGIQVRPHPHIGLSTITYLFAGEIMHRDSLGYVQSIRPGAVNLMTAGRGIVHSERAGDDLQSHASLHGIQSWMALPDSDAERDPEFVHYPADQLPRFMLGETQVTVIMGSAYDHTSPVICYLPTLYLEIVVPAGCSINLPEGYQEQAVYVVTGGIELDGVPVAACEMGVVETSEATVSAVNDSRVVVIGGSDPGDRKLWWNFVARDWDRIEQAKSDWKANRFGRVPGETEIIPLPE
ncbi:MAG: pirin family protein [Pseudomonadota bacterium]